ETLARLGELTAGIAHEFRNGLATIHGYSRLIDPAALPEKYQPYVEGIRQEAEALGKVVTNFLNFARPDQVVFAPVDLEALARHRTRFVDRPEDRADAQRARRDRDVAVGRRQHPADFSTSIARGPRRNCNTADVRPQIHSRTHAFRYRQAHCVLRLGMRDD